MKATPSGIYPNLASGAGAGATSAAPSAPPLSGGVNTAAAGAARAVAATGGTDQVKRHVTLFGYEYSNVRDTLLAAAFVLAAILVATAPKVNGENSLEETFKAQDMNISIFLLWLTRRMFEIGGVMCLLTPFIGVGTKPAEAA